MPITTLPAQDENSLGQSKSDAKPYADASTQVSAAIWNEVVLRVIELFGEVGKSDGSTADSLNARAKALENALASLRFPPPKTVNTSTYGLKPEDNGTTLICTHADGCTITVPGTLTAGFSVSALGTVAGKTVSWTGSGGLTVNAPTGFDPKCSTTKAISRVIVVSSSAAYASGTLDAA